MSRHPTPFSHTAAVKVLARRLFPVAPMNRQGRARPSRSVPLRTDWFARPPEALSSADRPRRVFGHFQVIDDLYGQPGIGVG